MVTTPAGPTGQIFNATSSFQLTPGNPARFIFASLSGQVAGWNPSVSPTSAVTAFTAPDRAVYTGLASGTVAGSNVLYAADFAGRKIDVLDAGFGKTTLAGSFTDASLPTNYAPYNVQNIGGQIYVEYAKVDPVTHRASEDTNQGAVDVYDASGNLLRRLATDAHLSSPWGITQAPASFGSFGSDLLVGNFGDGTISAFDPITGAFLGQLLDADGTPIANDGLWSLAFRASGSGFDPNTLFFTAGIEDEAHGLLGAIRVRSDLPEPLSVLLFGTGLVAMAGFRRVRR